MPEQFKCPHCGKHIPENLIAEHNRATARETGRIGGLKTAEKGSKYFSKLQKMRKKRSGGTHGGRPPHKSKKT